VTSIELPPERSAAAAARRFTREVAAPWALDPHVQADLELLVSELVTNAVLHARSSARLTIERTGDSLSRTPTTAQRRVCATTRMPSRGASSSSTRSRDVGCRRPTTARTASVWFEIATSYAVNPTELRS
jgi:two-component sensor histidine kinase